MLKLGPKKRKSVSDTFDKKPKWGYFFFLENDLKSYAGYFFTSENMMFSYFFY